MNPSSASASGCLHHFVRHPAKGEGIGLVEVLDRAAMHVFVRANDRPRDLNAEQSIWFPRMLSFTTSLTDTEVSSERHLTQVPFAA